MPNIIAETYQAITENVIKSITEESPHQKRSLSSLKRLWKQKMLNHPALQRSPKLKPVLLIDDMERVPIKISVPKKYQKDVAIHQMVILVPRFIVRQQLVGHVLYIEDIAKVIDLSKDLAEISVQLLVDDRCAILKQEIQKADEEVKAKNAAMKRMSDYNGNDKNIANDEEENKSNKKMKYPVAIGDKR